MDSLTHIVLAGAIAQSLYPRKLGRWGFLIAGIAATLPDLDIFIHTGNAVSDHVVHRYFSHAFVMAPLLAALAVGPFLLFKLHRPHARAYYLIALLAVLSHILLDACTSYGTLLLWPFSNLRTNWDLVAVVDITFTAILAGGVIVALRRKSSLPARIALAGAMLYLGLASFQHHRAASAQQELIALRHVHEVENPRVLPQLGAVLSYRSIYLHDGRIYADAIRVPLFGHAAVRTGSAIDCVAVQDLEPFPPSAAVITDFEQMEWFTDGFLARAPGDPHILADMRYTATPDGFDAVWGLKLEATLEPQWHTFPGTRTASRLWKEFIRPHGYTPLGAAAP